MTFRIGRYGLAVLFSKDTALYAAMLTQDNTQKSVGSDSDQTWVLVLNKSIFLARIPNRKF